MRTRLKFFGVLILHTLVALVGTAVVEAVIGRAYRPHSLGGVLAKEWLLSIICAGILGFFMWRTWRSGSAMWVWVLPTIWIAIRLFLVLLADSTRSVVSGGIWSQFSGEGCEAGPQNLACRNFFIFTIPFVRSVSYSALAYVAAVIDRGKM